MADDLLAALKASLDAVPKRPADVTPSVEKDAPLTEGGFRYSDRAAILCRTCLRPLTWETREEPGYNPRTGWYDDARSDPLVCFKARDYRHVPLTDREWAYYEAGQKSVTEASGGAVTWAMAVSEARDLLGWLRHNRPLGMPERTLDGLTAAILATAPIPPASDQGAGDE